MTGVPVLDTHAWIWWVDHDRRLGRRALDALDRLPADNRPILCDISLWETAMLVDRGRLSFDVTLRDWLEAATHPRSVHLLSITPEIVAEVAALPKTFHRDPADRIIVATCRILQAPLCTRDRLITRSRLVKHWKPEMKDNGPTH